MKRKPTAYPGFLALTGGLTLTVIVVYWSIPSARPALYREHHVLEWASALTFMAAGVVGTWSLCRAQTAWQNSRWLIPGLAFLAMLDEVKWIIFVAVKPPKVMDKPLDSLHDLLEVGLRWSRQYVPESMLFLSVGAAVGGVCLLAAMSRRFRDGLRASAPWQFFMIAAGLGVVSQFLDLAVRDDRFLKTIEEVLELDGALALLFSASLLRAENVTGTNASVTWIPRLAVRTRGPLGRLPDGRAEAADSERVETGHPSPSPLIGDAVQRLQNGSRDDEGVSDADR